MLTISAQEHVKIDVMYKFCIGKYPLIILKNLLCGLCWQLLISKGAKINVDGHQYHEATTLMPPLIQASESGMEEVVEVGNPMSVLQSNNVYEGRQSVSRV